MRKPDIDTRRGWGLAVSLVVGPAGLCHGQPEPESAAYAVYGPDTRLEYYAVPQDVQTLAQRTIAITSPQALTAWSERASEEVSLARVQGLCPGQTFAEQPAIAACSAVLVDDRHALTAMHCVQQLPCESMRLLAGYQYEREGEALQRMADNVYRCVASGPSATSALSGVSGDVVWVRLDRPVAGVEPMVLASEPVSPGEPLISMGYGGGLPLKIDLDAVALESTSGGAQLFLVTDTFGGSSGGPLYNSALELVGILVRGAPDYTETADGCREPVQYPMTDAGVSELLSYARPALTGLCEEPAPPGFCASLLTADAPPVPSATAMDSEVGAAGSSCSAALHRPTGAALLPWLVLVCGGGLLRVRRKRGSCRDDVGD